MLAKTVYQHFAIRDNSGLAESNPFVQDVSSARDVIGIYLMKDLLNQTQLHSLRQ
jgi:hypothetical protein